MRLGGQECLLKERSLVRKIYGSDKIVERHRHRYEVNNEYISRLEQAGLRVSAVSAGEGLCEMIELPKPNIHGLSPASSIPNLLPLPRAGHPLFAAFIEAAASYADKSHPSEAVLPANKT